MHLYKMQTELRISVKKFKETNIMGNCFAEQEINIDGKQSKKRTTKVVKKRKVSLSELQEYTKEKDSKELSIICCILFIPTIIYFITI